jgi:hypothetical protein
MNIHACARRCREQHLLARILHTCPGKVARARARDSCSRVLFGCSCLVFHAKHEIRVCPGPARIDLSEMFDRIMRAIRGNSTRHNIATPFCLKKNPWFLSKCPAMRGNFSQNLVNTNCQIVLQITINSGGPIAACD